MTQTTILRHKPRLEITFQENDFELSDHSTPDNSGIYSYSNLKSANIEKKWTNRFLSFLKYIPVGFMGSSKGGIVINNSNLQIELKNRTLKLWLKNADMTKAESVKRILDGKKPTLNTLKTML